MHTLPRRSALAWGVGGLVALTSMLIVLGALVRANGAGLACPDWPLCFGQAVPEFDLKVAFEWSHRVLAGGVGLVFLGLGTAILWRSETRGPAGRLVAIRRMIMAESEDERRAALADILPMQRADFVELFRIMAGLPVTVRLLDPPLHEFLPRSDQEFAEMASATIKQISR